MNVFDLGAGTLYALLALASSAYLLKGFRIDLRAMLKAMMAIQFLGDLLFSPLLQDLPVFRFLKVLSAEDRIYPLLVLMGCVIAMDVGAALFSTHAPPRPADTPGVAIRLSGQRKLNTAMVRSPIRSPSEMRFELDERRARQAGFAFIAFALIAKLTELVATGVLQGPPSFLSILTWQPESLVGFGFLGMLVSQIFPIGLALLVMSSKTRPHWLAIAAILAFSVLSPWKGEAIKLLIVYALFIHHFGLRHLRALFLSKKMLIALVTIVLLLSLKAQFRYLGEARLDSESLILGFVGTTSARVMGGVFQTYAYVFQSIQQGAPVLKGAYNAQVFYLWVPRMLWTDKPRFAGEQIYDYLDLSPEKDEPYGTSFALSVFGTFYLDFALWGSLACLFVLGGLMALGDNFLSRLKESSRGISRIFYVVLSTMWLNATFPLSEGGFPAAATQVLGGAAAVSFILSLFWLLKLPQHVPLRQSA